jgi:hypothetical protein
MDSKKTNLTPELKEIYDRVMNTSAASKAPAASSPPLPTTPPPAAPTIPSPQPSNTNPLPSTMPPLPQMPSAPNIGGPISPAQSIGMAVPPPAQAPSLPQMPNTDMGMAPLMPSPAEQALSNTPARPLTEGNTFSFNGVAHAPQPATGNSAVVKTKKKAKISLPVLIVLGIVFIAVWGVFWAIIFGFIKR